MKKRKKKSIFKRLFFFILIIAFLGSIYYAGRKGCFDLNEISYDGNKEFTSAELTNNLMIKPYYKYTPIFYLRYKFLGERGLPFLNDIDVRFKNMHAVDVSVYERRVIANIYYENKYLYINSDGDIIKISDIPNSVILIKGLNIKSYKLYEKPVLSNPMDLDFCINIINAVSRYKNTPKIIEFNSEGEIFLIYDKLTVKIKDTQDLNDKLEGLDAIFDKLPKRPGYIDLSRYQRSNDVIIFQKERSNKS